jgi:hypothetical protein
MSRPPSPRLSDISHGAVHVGGDRVHREQQNVAAGDPSLWTSIDQAEVGEVVKHMAQLVAKGYVQQQGVDFNEVIAPVTQIESMRLLLTLAAQEGWLV